MPVKTKIDHSTPAITIEAILLGFAALGFPVDQIRDKLRLRPSYFDPMEPLPPQVWAELWKIAFHYDQRPELPSLVAYQIPFGVFGALDYLASSTKTIRDSLKSLANYFGSVSMDTQLNVNFPANGPGMVRLVHYDQNAHEDEEESSIGEEYTIAVILARYSANQHFKPLRVYLRRPQLPGKVHEKLFGAPVIYEASTSGFDISPFCLDLQQESVDPHLHRLLSQFSRQLNLPRSDQSLKDVTIAIRSSLLYLLPQGRSSASEIANQLGISDRSLHRRLEEIGANFQQVLDQFRLEQSEKLISEERLSFSEIAFELGFSDQSGWSRFFKRVRGTTPSQWKKTNHPRAT